MKLSQDHIYEEIAATYQCLEFERLNEILKKHGLDVTVRREICEEFVFSSGVFFDQFWFEAEENKMLPRICFLEMSTELDSAEDHTLFIPCEDFSFHEYAYGNSSWYFDEHNEDASEIGRGENPFRK
jgi:hypothetical protein